MKSNKTKLIKTEDHEKQLVKNIHKDSNLRPNLYLVTIIFIQHLLKQ